LEGKIRSATKTGELSSAPQVIAEGVSAVVARPWIMVIPLLLDLYYLLGWRITLGPALERLGGWAAGWSWSGGERIDRVLSEAGALDLAGVFGLVVPTFLGGVDRDGMYDPVSRSGLSIEHGIAAVIVLAMFLTLAALLYAVFGVWLADIGLERERSWKDRVRMVPDTAARILGLAFLIAGLLALLSLPVVLAWAAASVAGVELQGLLLSVLTLIGLAVIVFCYFAPEALFVTNAGPAEALRLSARVVKRSGWATLGFILATTIISWGLSDVWERMATNLPGMLLALAGNAFVGCSLAIAAVRFFAERWRVLANDLSG
jgi:hypothetical protein